MTLNNEIQANSNQNIIFMNNSMDERRKALKKTQKPNLESPYKGNIISAGNIKNNVSLDRYSHISEEEKRGNNFKRKSSTPEKIR